MRKLRTALPYVLFVGALAAVAFHATLSAYAVRHFPSLSQLALEHLARMGERALPFVLEFLGANDPRLKQAGLSLLKAIGEAGDWSDAAPELLNTVIEQFRKEADPALKRQFAAVLGTSNSKQAVEALGSGAKDPAIRNACVNALRAIAERAPNPALRDAAKQAGAFAGSAEAAKAVSSVVDTASTVARPALDTVDAVLGGAGLRKSEDPSKSTTKQGAGGR
ncbi:MAG: HEAT repeat domain-containing protein [Candidatus Wallbacteria bacterium]|nr:HEAT repeat domain-containing protein [Candidatus Wallbacteria bacterium]